MFFLAGICKMKCQSMGYHSLQISEGKASWKQICIESIQGKSKKMCKEYHSASRGPKQCVGLASHGKPNPKPM